METTSRYVDVIVGSYNAMTNMLQLYKSSDSDTSSVLRHLVEQLCSPPVRIIKENKHKNQSLPEVYLATDAKQRVYALPTSIQLHKFKSEKKRG